MNIFLIIIAIISVIISIFCIKYKRKEDFNTKVKNIEIIQENERLNRIKESYQKDLADLKNLCNSLQTQRDSLQCSVYNTAKQLSDVQQQITDTLNNQKKSSQEAFENYIEVLETKYKEVEEEHDMEIDALNTAYSNLQLQLMREADECKADLEKLRATRAAAIEAQRKEKEISEKQSFYCLKISNNDLKDIGVLESIKPKLNNSRILSMLIWQTWFRTPMTNLCNNIIGRETKTGIYKITNQLTKECYIGQAVDLSTRWKEHAKCGLGIDTPAANKLYKAMQEYGLYSFSWEVLEFCPREQLNEKEKFYIELYQAKEFGYNGTSGNK